MQQKQKQKGNSRRRFLFLSLLTGLGLAIGKTGAKAAPPKEEGDTVKMLTPDGRLVEVPKSSIEAAKSRNKASNKDILSWRKPFK